MAGRARLAGIRVADFTWVWAGPFCTLQLAHLGAAVVRVETATRACVPRLLPPFAGPTGGLHGAGRGAAAPPPRGGRGPGPDNGPPEGGAPMAGAPGGNRAAGEDRRGPERDGNRDAHMAPHGVFRAAGDDRWVAIAVEDDAAWARFAAAIGRPELASDPRWATAAARKQSEDELEEMVTAWTSARAPEEATAALQAAGVAAFTAATNRDLAEDPHLNARGFFTALPHPVVGTRQHVGVPWRMSESDCRVRRAAPCLGADTDQVLRDVCGYSEAEIARLRAAAALVEPA